MQKLNMITGAVKPIDGCVMLGPALSPFADRKPDQYYYGQCNVDGDHHKQRDRGDLALAALGTDRTICAWPWLVRSLGAESSFWAFDHLFAACGAVRAT